MNSEFKHMNRSQLVQMLIAQMDENEQLKEQLAEANLRLKERQINLDKAGSIAEAALQISGIFEVAQSAADQYLQSIQALDQRQGEVVDRMIHEAEQHAAQLLNEAEEYSRNTRRQADQYWEQVQQQAMNVLKEQDNLKALVEQGRMTEAE